MSITQTKTARTTTRQMQHTQAKHSFFVTGHRRSTPLVRGLLRPLHKYKSKARQHSTCDDSRRPPEARGWQGLSFGKPQKARQEQCSHRMGNRRPWRGPARTEAPSHSSLWTRQTDGAVQHSLRHQNISLVHTTFK